MPYGYETNSGQYQYQQHPNAMPVQHGQHQKYNPQINHQVPAVRTIQANQQGHIDQKQMQPNQQAVPAAINPNAVNANDKH